MMQKVASFQMVCAAKMLAIAGDVLFSRGGVSCRMLNVPAEKMSEGCFSTCLVFYRRYRQQTPDTSGIALIHQSSQQSGSTVQGCVPAKQAGLQGLS